KTSSACAHLCNQIVSIALANRSAGREVEFPVGAPPAAVWALLGKRTQHSPYSRVCCFLCKLTCALQLLRPSFACYDVHPAFACLDVLYAASARYVLVVNNRQTPFIRRGYIVEQHCSSCQRYCQQKSPSAKAEGQEGQSESV